jgi:Protein of unknown function (DUF2911)
VKVRFALSLVMAIGLPTLSAAQEERGQVEATIGAAHLTMDYGRPSLRGRDMLAQAVPGTVWRLGSGEATRLVTNADLILGELALPKGQYTLFANRVDEKNWRLIINEQVGQDGTEYDASMDLGSTPLVWETKDDSTEQFTAEIAKDGGGGELRFIWGKSILKAPFQVK